MDDIQAVPQETKKIAANNLSKFNLHQSDIRYEKFIARCPTCSTNVEHTMKHQKPYSPTSSVEECPRCRTKF